MRKSLVGLIAFALVVTASAVAPSRAEACFDMCIVICSGGFCEIYCNSELKPRAIYTEITPLPGRGAMVTVYGGTSARMENDFACATAIPWLPEIAGPRRGANLRETESNALIYELEPSAGPIEDFRRLARETMPDLNLPSRWLGYHVTVRDRSIEPSVAKMVYRFDLKPGKTVYDLAESLRENGLMMSGSANFDGTLDYHHWDYLLLGDYPIVITGDGFDARRGDTPLK